MKPKSPALADRTKDGSQALPEGCAATNRCIQERYFDIIDHQIIDPTKKNSAGLIKHVLLNRWRFPSDISYIPRHLAKRYVENFLSGAQIHT